MSWLFESKNGALMRGELQKLMEDPNNRRGMVNPLDTMCYLSSSEPTGTQFISRVDNLFLLINRHLFKQQSWDVPRDGNFSVKSVIKFARSKIFSRIFGDRVDYIKGSCRRTLERILDYMLIVGPIFIKEQNRKAVQFEEADYDSPHDYFVEEQKIMNLYSSRVYGGLRKVHLRTTDDYIHFSICYHFEGSPLKAEVLQKLRAKGVIANVVS